MFEKRQCFASCRMVILGQIMSWIVYDVDKIRKFKINTLLGIETCHELFSNYTFIMRYPILVHCFMVGDLKSLKATIISMASSQERTPYPPGKSAFPTEARLCTFAVNMKPLN